MSATPATACRRRAPTRTISHRVASLPDGAWGAAWTVRPDPDALLGLLTNYIYDVDFAAATLQLVWGLADAPVLTLKSYQPPVSTSWATAARRLVAATPRRHRVSMLRTRAIEAGPVVPRASESAFLRQVDVLTDVAGLAGLRPTPIVHPERLRQECVGASPDLAKWRVTPLDGPSAVRPSRPERVPTTIASLRRHPELPLDAIAPLLAASAHPAERRTLTFIEGQRSADHAAAWLFPFVTAPDETFSALERHWAAVGFRLVPETTLAPAAHAYAQPFGAVPALETSLAPCAMRLIVGLPPGSPRAAVAVTDLDLPARSRPGDDALHCAA